MGGIKRDKYDALVSDITRQRAKWSCERCSKQYTDPTTRGGLHCSHFKGRGNASTRYDLDNLDSLCFGCHNFLGADPPAYTEWKRNKLGEERFKSLLKRKEEIKRWTKKEKEEWYKPLKKEYERDSE